MLNKVLFWIIAVILIVVRIWFGSQINFHHEDYEQIYLMGIQYVTESNWSYWGPDVVWSETRLAGGLQPLLVGLPLQLINHPIAPFILSNIISSLGLILLSLYASYRLKLPRIFVLSFVMTLPFLFFHGSVVLNTAYLLLPGALLFISVFELFLYRDKPILKNVYWYFFALGFSLLFVYQLHLTWVTILPFLVVLIFMEFKNQSSSIFKICCYFFAGTLLSSITLIPTLWNFHELMFDGVSGNLNFKLEKIYLTLELFTRYLDYATYDISPTFQFFGIASDQNNILKFALYTLKAIGVLQIIFIIVVLWINRQSKTTQNLLILFGLTLLMNIILYMLGRKHLESRTYILLYALPVFMYLYTLSQITLNKTINVINYSIIIICLFGQIAVGFYNYQGKHSIQHYQDRIEKSLELNDYHQFGERRKTKMD